MVYINLYIYTRQPFTLTILLIGPIDYGPPEYYELEGFVPNSSEHCVTALPS